MTLYDEILKAAKRITPLPWVRCCDVHDRIPCGCRYGLQCPPEPVPEERTSQQFADDEAYKLLAANNAPAMAEARKRIGEILGPKLRSEREKGWLSDETQSALVITMAEARELMALLEGK